MSGLATGPCPRSSSRCGVANRSSRGETASEFDSQFMTIADRETNLTIELSNVGHIWMSITIYTDKNLYLHGNVFLVSRPTQF